MTQSIDDSINNWTIMFIGCNSVVLAYRMTAMLNTIYNVLNLELKQKMKNLNV